MKNALLCIAGALFLSGVQLFGAQHAKLQPNDKENPPEEEYCFCCEQLHVPELIFSQKPSRYQKRRWQNPETPNPQHHARNPRASRRAIPIRHYRR